MVYKASKNGVSAEVNTQRFDNQFRAAKKRLNILVVTDSTPFVPFQQGQLRSQTRYPDGIYGDYVEWYAPYAHYQYNGTVLTDEAGRTFVGAGEVKPIDTGRPLNYTEPGTGDHWFEQAKEQNINKWTREVKRIAGGK